MRTSTLIRLTGPDLPMHTSLHPLPHIQSHSHSLTHLHLPVIRKNTNMVERMTRAYCINQKNPEETFVEHF